MTVRLAVLGIGQQMRLTTPPGWKPCDFGSARMPQRRSSPRLPYPVVEDPAWTPGGSRESGGAVIVDAVRSGSAAGTLHHIEVEDLSAYSQGSCIRTQLGCRRGARLRGHTGPQLTAAPDQTDRHRSITDWIGAALSPAVQSALPAIAMELEAAVGELLQA